MQLVTEDNVTGLAEQRWGTAHDPRLAEIMTALVRHLHDFAREVRLTEDEWMAAISWLNRAGQISDDKRQEFILASDVLGVSMLVDSINHRVPTGATPTTVEGPFHVADAPELADGADMAKGCPGIPCFITGKVRGLDGAPVAGATLDLWQTDGEGFYEAQRDVTEPWMRGLYHTRPDGSYVVRTVAPIAYTIPMDGTIGELMRHTDISHMRPAHIHFCVTAPGYHRLVTHLFQRGDEFIDTDVVYGVKEPLIVEFQKRPAGSKAPNGETVDTDFYVVNYDFVLDRAVETAIAAE
jgi:hydroxyquinol 1,2-dioxygenase